MSEQKYPLFRCLENGPCAKVGDTLCMVKNIMFREIIGYWNNGTPGAVVFQYRDGKAVGDPLCQSFDGLEPLNDEAATICQRWVAA